MWSRRWPPSSARCVPKKIPAPWQPEPAPDRHRYEVLRLQRPGRPENEMTDDQPSPLMEDALRWLAVLQDGAIPPAEQRSEEHTSELQPLMRISYAVFCLKKKKTMKSTH